VSFAEEIKGKYCYSSAAYEPLLLAREISEALALRRAIENSEKFQAMVKDVHECKVKNSIVEVAAGCAVNNVKIESQEIQERTVCTSLTGDLDVKILENIIWRKAQSASPNKDAEFEGLLSNEKVRILNYYKEGSFVKILYQAKRDLDYGSFMLSITSLDMDGRQIKRHASHFPLKHLLQWDFRWASLPLDEKAVSFELGLE
jgi:hypothetical protein